MFFLLDVFLLMALNCKSTDLNDKLFALLEIVSDSDKLSFKSNYRNSMKFTLIKTIVFCAFLSAK